MSDIHPGAGPVLDYASPRPRGKVRLPSQSRIELRPDRDGVIVHEWLAAKGQAVFAIVFAGASLALLASVYVIQESPHWKADFTDAPVAAGIAVLLLLGLIGSGIVVLLRVINNTWRSTTLEARAEGLMLTFRAPSGQQRYEWNAAEVEEIRLESTTRPTDRNQLSEIQIRLAARPLVKLFTDHATRDLEPIAGAIRQAIGATRPSAGTIERSSTAPEPYAEPKGQTP